MDTRELDTIMAGLVCKYGTAATGMALARAFDNSGQGLTEKEYEILRQRGDRIYQAAYGAPGSVPKTSRQRRAIERL